MTERITPAVPNEHARHDPEWMAALASRDPDLSAAERTSAEAALMSCGACADLFAELVAVSAAIPSAAIPARPRDFTLTPADAARLRPRGLRRWLAGIGSVRDGITFPLAMGLTTMGIAGLLVATVPGALSSMSGATAGAAPETLSAVGAAIPAPAAASEAPVAASRAAAASAAPAPAASPEAAESVDGNALNPLEPDAVGGGGVFSGDGGDGGERSSADGQRQDVNDMTADASIREENSGFSTLMIVAATLLIAGLGLFALRWSARRLL
jgi:hypothetical protein